MVTPHEVKKAREFLGESQAAFGARFAVDQSTVHRWETDGPPKRGPAKLVVEKLINDVAEQMHRAEAAQ